MPGQQSTYSIVGAIRMERLGERNRPSFGYLLKVHTFRTVTAVLALGLIVVAFYQKPELLTNAQLLMQRGTEAVGDAVPSPWGRGWIAFRELGGLIWLQITIVILTLRIMLSTVAATWRLIFRTTGPSRLRRMSDPVALAVYGVLTLAFFVFLFLVLLAL
jgi:hypothetical protein